MSQSSFARSALTGRLADSVGQEFVLAVVTIAVITGISVWRLEGPWLYALPGAAVGYSAIRIALVARRNRRESPG